METKEEPKKKRFWKFYDTLILGLVIVLAVTVFDSGGPHIRVAMRARAANYANQIGAACFGYYTEYGEMPKTSDNSHLRRILCGDNQRKIEFLNLRPRDMSPNGGMIDPWGTPFRITFDPDSKVHVISAGPDKVFGTPDDITNQ